MIEKEFVIKNPFGLHIRPANEFVRRIAKFKSSVKIVKNEEIADGKCVMDLLTLVLQYNDKIKVIVDGEDENETMEVIQDFIEHDFYYQPEKEK